YLGRNGLRRCPRNEGDVLGKFEVSSAFRPLGYRFKELRCFGMTSIPTGLRSDGSAGAVPAIVCIALFASLNCCCGSC
ncbi:hypothetical protein, partial [Streptococcus agalactiae]|uniref:hypothetical protein n=1 Tax=Streptococcus agalactiae TaxID=1311 RepID=UPI002553E24E